MSETKLPNITDPKLPLEEIIYLMPRFLGQVMYPGGFPINTDQHMNVDEALPIYYDWVLKKGSEPSDEQFQCLRQYLIYYVHAPIWQANPHYDTELKAEFDLIRLKTIAVTNWDELASVKWELIEFGLDPF